MEYLSKKNLRKLRFRPWGRHFFVAFRPKQAHLNRAVSNFGLTVLEGFYELSKILEISTSTIGKVHVSEIADLAGA